ncbi:MAG: hypothetical protein CM15mP111_4220 [Hyphomicrobiales bacterium]|nr:MAG: hypothetical protein CM15mP111_4220 [Hyphomicrobiales bacterium]
MSCGNVFDEAINFFDENFLYSYFDGMQKMKGGKKFCEWYKKLKIGGFFWGDDYSKNGRWLNGLKIWYKNLG